MYTNHANKDNVYVFKNIIEYLSSGLFVSNGVPPDSLEVCQPCSSSKKHKTKPSELEAWPIPHLRKRLLGCPFSEFVAGVQDPGTPFVWRINTVQSSQRKMEYLQLHMLCRACKLLPNWDAHWNKDSLALTQSKWVQRYGMGTPRPFFDGTNRVNQTWGCSGCSQHMRD